MNIDEFIEHAKEKAREHRYHADFFESDNPMNKACIKSAEDCEQLAEWLEKSKEYLDLEEQGLLLRLPCKVGTKVYAINIIIDYGEIGDEATYSYSIIEREFQIYMMMDYGKLVFGKTVFLTQAEAEAKLKELRG